MIINIGFALTFWAFILSAANPFFQDKTLRYITLVLALGATICFVIGAGS